MTGVLGEDWLFTAVIGLFLLAGVGLMLGALIQAFKIWQFVHRSVTMTGTVTTLVLRRPDETSILTRTKRRGGVKTTYKLKPMAPQVRFATADGETITFTHHTASDPPTYKIGQEVTVRYQPGRPHEAQIGSFSSLWAMPLLLFFVGSIITLVISILVIPNFGGPTG